jgi:hypothetical protein
LRLVDDHVSVRLGRAVEQRARLVQQGQVTVAPPASAQTFRSEHSS